MTAASTSTTTTNITTETAATELKAKVKSNSNSNNKVMLLAGAAYRVHSVCDNINPVVLNLFEVAAR